MHESSGYSAAAEPVAIVGVGCRLPGNISTVDDLVHALRDGRDCITELPPERWDVEQLYDPDPATPGKTYVRHGGFVADIRYFDAGFFGISAAEASRMDPQQRLLLETVWHTLEQAGQSAEELAGSNTGVFLAMMNTNAYFQLKSLYEGLAGVTGHDAMADMTSIAAGRISHFLGLEGPCLTLDTACSGSMVGLHLARQSILAGECDSAIVAGVNVIVTPHFHVASSKLEMLSRSGRCRSFDQGADGYIRSEGCVAVLLRRESLAVARGDRILARVVASAINHDGRTPTITAPNGQAQERVMRLALARAGMDAAEIGYVEAHGSGTPVGDPIEMAALVNVYGRGRSDQQPLYVGSAKTNFGHIEAGAGLLGVVKAALSLDSELIFPSLHFKELNRNIDLAGAPVRVPTASVRWPRGDQRRLAAINSFGYSGTNAHVVLQESAADRGVAAAPARPCELIVLSAKSAAGLQELADKWSDFLEQESPVAFGDIAFTAATGRSQFRHRLAVVTGTKTEASEKLLLWCAGRIPNALAVGQAAATRKSKVAFVFTGQGAQYAGMGRSLYDEEFSFRSAIDRCAGVMDAELGVPLRDVLFGPDAVTLLGNTRYVQPALFALEFALADLLRNWGIEPDYLIGHSVGEIVAATIAGLIELEDAVRLVVARGRLMGELPRVGRMLAIDATADQAAAWFHGKAHLVSIAAVNGPSSVVVSGAAEAVGQVEQIAAAAGHRTKELEVSHAFHSPLMEPILEEVEKLGISVNASAAKTPVVSNVTGQFFEQDIPGSYWAAHARKPVMFHQGLTTIMAAGCTTFIELGPHPALTPVMGAFVGPKAQCIPTLMRDQQDLSHMLRCAGSLHVGGVPVRLDRVLAGSSRRRVQLPLYPFRRDRHWIRVDHGFVEPSKPRAAISSQPKPELHPLLGRVVTMGPQRAVFESSLAATQPWVDHRILGATVFPGTGYLEMAARAFAESKAQDWQSVAVRDVGFERPLVMAYGKPKKITLTLDTSSANGAGESSFAVAEAGTGDAESYCRGRIAMVAETTEKVDFETALGRMQSKLDVGPFYGELRQRSIEYGASFSTIRELWLGPNRSGEAIARVAASPRANGSESHPFVYTTVLDGCLQVFGAALRTLGESGSSGAFVAHAIRSATLCNRRFSQLWSHARVRIDGDGRSIVAHIRVVSDAGELFAQIDGLELRQIARFSLMQDGQRAAPSGQISESREQFVKRLTDLPAGQRPAVLVRWLIGEVEDILGQAAAEIDFDNLEPSTKFIEIGLDSLLATELQRRVQEKLELRFKPMETLNSQSVESLAEFILAEVLFADTPAAAQASTPEDGGGA